MFRSDEDGERTAANFDFVLFDHDTVHELSPKTCPVCAVIDFEASDCQANISKVSYDIRTSYSGVRYCTLWISLGDFNRHQALMILPAEGKLIGIITHTY
jgi:hypothetical protein